MLNMELSLSQRPFQEVTSGSSIPSSGPNGESRAPVLIDCPHSPFENHRRHIKLKNEAFSPSARIAAADLAAQKPSPIHHQGFKRKSSGLGSKHYWAHYRRLVDRSERVIFTSAVYPRLVE